MRLILVLILLACTLPVIAGNIVVGFCEECGYQTDEFFAGYGKLPGYVAEVYRDTETGEFHLVRFNIIEIRAEEIAAIINNSFEEVGEIFAGWSSPEVLGDISPGGVLPTGVNIDDELSGNPLNWKLVSLYDDLYPCPVCCGETLEFQWIGNWD